MARLRAGAPDAAWDLFVDRYRRLLFAAIRHYVQDHDDVMDVFAWVCEALRKDDLRRLRTYLDASSHRARFSTWLVTVVRHLAVDWLRHRDGRRGRLVREIVQPLSEPVDESAPAIEAPDQQAWLERALATLTPEDRVAVELYVVQELPAADIARILRLPNAKAVYNRVYRALDALRAWLESAGIAAGDL